MRFGVNAWVWTSPVTTAELERLAPRVAAMGFDWIEAPLESLSDLDPARGAEIVRAAGLGVSACAAMGPDRDLIHPDAAIRENGMAYVRGAIDAAHALGASNLIWPIYSAVGRSWQQTPEEREADLQTLVANLRALAEYAGERGVTLCLEPLNRFETSFINLASQAIEVVDRVNHPACQIMLDTFHMNIEEKNQHDAIVKAGKHLAHFHACGCDRGTPGNDHINWEGVVKGLKKINYQGDVVIESFTTDVKVIARAAAIWRRMEPTRNEIAVKGLKNVRKAFGK